MAEHLATPATLKAALAAVKPGDVLRLAPGTYPGASFPDWKVADAPIMVTSADPASPAVLGDFTLRDAEGVTFRDLVFAATLAARDVWAFQFVRCRRLTLEGVRVHGSRDGDAANDANGVSVRFGGELAVLGCEFSDLGRALAVSHCAKVTVSGNLAHDLRTDGFNFAQVEDVDVDDNVIRDLCPVGRDHPDGIQFWTSGTTTPSRRIRIRRNRLERGKGAAFQGIFLRDQLETLPYEDVEISDNLLLCTGWKGIGVNGARRLTLARNRLVTFAALGDVPPAELRTYALIMRAEGVQAVGNMAASRTEFVFEPTCSGVVEAGTVFEGVVTDGGAAALVAWQGLDPRDVRIGELEAALAAADERASRAEAKCEALQRTIADAAAVLGR